MKISKFKDKESWLEARKTKITGSRLKDIVVKRGTGQKIGYYELIAERLALPGTGQDPMERGIELEGEAIERFAKETGKKVDTSLVIWMRDDNESIAISPDGFIGTTEAVEVKCLASARHIEALLTGELPTEYEMQAYQYFIVNDKLKTLYFCFYDPRLSVKDFFFKTIKRSEVQEKIDEYLEYQKKILAEVNTIVNQLSF
ncbi:YqaJ viral recombinase family protein [Candidatus Curtissbacteria bacterium]|nr:YqaJ viral recombinase family protein [Candidatus Curtissbacteria bacterium]